jgi:thiamine biosynthesis lipoprotein
VTVDLERSTITAGEPIDLGGIGKGAAADLIVRELGGDVAGGCINVGGDLRAWGEPPDGATGWSVAVDAAGVTVSVVEGAIATSSTERRRWPTVDGDAHHLIDPRTGRPAVSDLRAVTVVDESALAAEVLAKAALIAGSVAAADVLRGAPALLHTDDALFAVNGMEAYLS